MRVTRFLFLAVVFCVTFEKVHWGFAGTRVLAGSGALRVLNTGADTLYGQIVRTATETKRVRTPLQTAIGQLVVVLSVAAALLCIILALVRWHQGHGWVDALVSATTLAVASVERHTMHASG